MHTKKRAFGSFLRNLYDRSIHNVVFFEISETGLWKAHKVDNLRNFTVVSYDFEDINYNNIFSRSDDHRTLKFIYQDECAQMFGENHTIISEDQQRLAFVQSKFQYEYKAFIEKPKHNDFDSIFRMLERNQVDLLINRRMVQVSELNQFNLRISYPFEFDKLYIIIPFNYEVDLLFFLSPKNLQEIHFTAAAVLIVVLLISLSYYIFKKCTKFEITFLQSFTNVVCCICGIPFAIRRISKGEKILLSALLMLNGFLFSTYNSSLISSLLKPMSKEIETIEELRQSGMTLMYDEEFNENVVESLKETFHGSSVTLKPSTLKPWTEGKDDQNSVAFILSVHSVELFLESNLNSIAGRLRYYMMKEIVYDSPTSIYISRAFYLKDRFDNLLLRAEEAGLETFWKHVIIQSSSFHGVNNFAVHNEKDQHKEVFTSNQLIYIFWGYLIGLFASTIVFLLENVIFYRIKFYNAAIFCVGCCRHLIRSIIIKIAHLKKKLLRNQNSAQNEPNIEEPNFVFLN